MEVTGNDRTKDGRIGGSSSMGAEHLQGDHEGGREMEYGDDRRKAG